MGMGLAGFVFNDFGPSHAVKTPTENKNRQSFQAFLKVDLLLFTDKRHGLKLAITFVFCEIVGMEPLNGHPLLVIKCLNPFAFRLEGVCPRNMESMFVTVLPKRSKTPKGTLLRTFPPQALELQELPDSLTWISKNLRTSDFVSSSPEFVLLTANPAGDARQISLIRL